MRRVVTFSCAFIVLFSVGSAQAHSGHTVWGGWTFDWEVKDNAGLALRDLYFNNELVAFKMSLPGIRVRYAKKCSECGPYLDQINWGKMRKITDCGNKKVCQRSFSYDGRNWLEIGVRAVIGAYRLYQVYYLSHDGWIHAELASKGLHALVDHDHHAYWRFDFYINSNPSEQIKRYDGLQITEYTHSKEFNETKNPSTDPDLWTNRHWFIRDPASGHGVLVMRSVWGDGTADTFSNLDAGARLYKPSEDIGWKFGIKGELGYNEGEDIQDKDVVFWYVGHLHHKWKEDGVIGYMYPEISEWHKTGPRLFLKR